MGKSICLSAWMGKKDDRRTDTKKSSFLTCEVSPEFYREEGLERDWEHQEGKRNRTGRLSGLE